jgi:drug/metabolite transporter (DMT)-like permease
MVMIFWGSAFVSARSLAQQYPPMVIAFLRFLLAVLFLFPLLYYKEKRILPLRNKHFLYFALLGLTGVFTYNVFFFTGLNLVEAGRASVIIALNPLITALLSILLFTEKFIKLQYLGLVCGLIGTHTVISNGNLLSILNDSISIGDFYLIMAVLSWCSYTLLGKMFLQHFSVIEAISWACLFGVVYFIPFVANEKMVETIINFSFLDFLNLTNIGLLSTVLGFVWYYQAVKELGPSLSSSFINIVPIIAVISGAFFLNERPPISLYIGGILTIIGVILVNRKNRIK